MYTMEGQRFNELCKHETKVVPRENSLSSFEDEGLFLFHAKLVMDASQLEGCNILVWPD